MRRILSVTVRFCIIVFFVIISTNFGKTVENKKYDIEVNRSINLSTMAMKLEELIENDIYSSKDTYTGDLTGYIYNCPLCNGTLGCMPKYNIKDGTITYPDETYGTVNIVASSTNLPCGSIVRFNVSKINSEPVVAIVLDRGVIGNDLDFLSPSYEYAINLGRVVVTYDVLREGWSE